MPPLIEHESTSFVSSEHGSEFSQSKVSSVVDLDFLGTWTALVFHDVLRVGVRELHGYRLAGVGNIGNEAHLVHKAAIISLELKIKDSVSGLICGNSSCKVIKSGVSGTLCLKHNLTCVISDPGNKEASTSLVNFAESCSNFFVNLD